MQIKDIKDTLNGKEDVKLSLFPNNMLLYLENPKGCTKVPRNSSSGSKVADYKISVQKFMAFLYINNEIE